MRQSRLVTSGMYHRGFVSPSHRLLWLSSSPPYFPQPLFLFTVYNIALPNMATSLKSRRQCPGYKDEFDLMFRNETRATERRAQKASRKASVKVDAEQSRSPSADAKPPVQSPSELSISPTIQIPTETQATCHFVSNFVLLPRQGSARGFMDYLIPVMKMDPDAVHLQHAFKACALASLGNRVSSDGVNFHEQSYGEYAKALRATNIAIRDPKTSTSDSLLAAVLLLSLFEVSGVVTQLCLSSLLTWEPLP
jgi:hypothetical protein